MAPLEPPTEGAAATATPPEEKSIAWAAAMYGGEDGVLDATEEIMMKYDVDKNGTFSISEVKAIVSDLEQKKKSVRNLKKMLVGVVFVAVVVCALLFGLMFASNEAAKENHTKDGVMTDLGGSPVQVDTVESVAGLWDLAQVPLPTFSKIKTVGLFMDVKNYRGMPDGLYQGEFKISGAYKQTDDVVFLSTYEGYMITINGTSTTGKIQMEAHEFPIYNTKDKSRRLGSVCDGETPCMPKGRAQLRTEEGRAEDGRRLTAFGGALMTSGSFTMMSGGGAK